MNKKFCGRCKKIIKIFHCMKGKDDRINHLYCDHPVFCSEICRERFLNTNWNFAV